MEGSHPTLRRLRYSDRMRVIAALVTLVVAVLLALWFFDVIELPGTRPATVPAQLDVFAAIATNDAVAVQAALAAGGNLLGLDAAGLTPLMAAAAAGADNAVLAVLLDGGADVNQQAASGVTALMLAARQAGATTVLYLLNAGADPTLRDLEGRSAIDDAAGNSAVRNSGLYRRLVELGEHPFRQGWPSAYVMPVPGSTMSSRRHHLPGAPRAYRNGVHQGFDFFAGTVSVPIEYGTPIVAVAQGTVVRADTAYEELSVEAYQAIIAEAMANLDTPPEVLDKLRGRQVWIRHPGGFVSRYAHLSSIAEGIAVGAVVVQGQTVGATGNSGTEEAARHTQDDPHPHVEIWNGDTYLGQDMDGDTLYATGAQVWGQAALPPYHD